MTKHAGDPPPTFTIHGDTPIVLPSTIRLDEMIRRINAVYGDDEWCYVYPWMDDYGPMDLFVMRLNDATYKKTRDVVKLYCNEILFPPGQGYPRQGGGAGGVCAPSE